MIKTFLYWPIFGNTIIRITISIIALIIFYGILELGKKSIINIFLRKNFYGKKFIEIYRIIGKLAKKTQSKFIFIISLYFASLNLFLNVNLELIIKIITFLSILIQIGLWGDCIILFWLKTYQKKRIENKNIKNNKEKNDGFSFTMIYVFTFLARLSVWLIIIQIALDHFGFNITALIAGLGLGGIVVALAVQNILKDVFSSLSIILDQPFIIGDTIAIDNYLGIIEYVGLKTTRIRSINGELIIFPNSNLLESRIKNFRDQKERRINFLIKITYETSLEKITAIPNIIKNIISFQKNTRFERSHLTYFDYNLLCFENIYWITVPDYNIYMDIQQKILLNILNEFSKQKIQLAHTQKIFCSTK